MSAVPTADAAFMFERAFVTTIQREWPGLDRHRLVCAGLAGRRAALDARPSQPGQVLRPPRDDGPLRDARGGAPQVWCRPCCNVRALGRGASVEAARASPLVAGWARRHCDVMRRLLSSPPNAVRFHVVETALDMIAQLTPGVCGCA